MDWYIVPNTFDQINIRDFLIFRLSVTNNRNTPSYFCQSINLTFSVFSLLQKCQTTIYHSVLFSMLWVTRLFKKTHLKQVVFFFDTMIYGKRDFFVFHHDIGSLTP